MYGAKDLRKMLMMCLAVLLALSVGKSQELDLKKMFQEGIPASPFAGIIYNYADAMLEHGRDTYGPQKTGLFLSALDRQTLSPLKIRPPAPAGIRESDRPGPADGPLVGANPHLDENLLRLMYFLKGLSGEERYPQAADNALKWFLENAQSQDTGLLPWGEHLSWNVMTDGIASGHRKPVHEFARPWLLWPRCFELTPEPSKKFALGLWNSQIADHETGSFNRHANIQESSPQSGMDFARHVGFYIRTWAEAFAYTRDRTFLRAIDVLLKRYEKKRHPMTGLIEVVSGSSNANSALSLSLGIDCDGAARKVPEPLRTRLRQFALCEDEIFCSLSHDLKNKKGFALTFDLATGKSDGSFSSLWDTKYGAFTTAAVAMMCVSRYHNTGNATYRDLIVAAADAYMDSMPTDDVDAWPMTFGHAISLELAAFAASSQEKYYKQAFKFGESAVRRFFDNSVLPRASLKTDHYESITGADTLVLALVELHLSTLHITAVRAPANTIDR
jgi:hypothetical protein